MYMKTLLHKSIGITFLSLVILSGCRMNEKRWDTQIETPLFNADLGFEDLVDDSLLVVNDDGSYNMVYEYVYQIDSVSSYLDVPDTLDKVRITLDKLVLADRTFADTITLREIDPQVAAFDGFTLPLDAQRIENPEGEQEIDVSEEFFQTAKFNKGFLDITIHNDLPVYIDNIIFKLSNKKDGSLIGQDTFSNIAPFDSATQSIDLAGKEVDGILVGSIILIETRASSGPVLIDADKGIRLGLSVRELEPEYATAIFPEQTLVEDKQEVVYKFGDAQVTEIKARSGNVKMRIASTIEEEIIIDYWFPFSGEDGDFNKPFRRQWRVPPAKPGQTQIIEGEFPLDGYVMQYKGKDPSQPPFFNTVYSELTARTVYSGVVRDLSLEDYVEIEFGLVEIKPEYAFGDFGYKEYTLNETNEIPVFKNVSGAFNLEDVTMNVFLENAFGIEALTTINELKAINSNTNKEVSLQHGNVIGQDILLRRATNPPLSAYRQQHVFDKSTSNIKDFLSVLPDKITTDIDIISRPNGSNDYRDFVKDESYLRARLLLALPVQFGMKNLQLVQKQAFDFNSLTNSDRIKSGTFKLRVDNDFPIEMNMVAEFLSEDDQVLLTLFDGAENVEAAELDPTTGKTTASKTSDITAEVSEMEMDILRDATKVRIKSIFNTPGSDNQKLFSTYRIKTKLLGDFTYEQST